MSGVTSAVLGFPRIGMSFRFFDAMCRADELSAGPNREIKKAVESYWAFKTSAEDLQTVAKEVKQKRWESIKGKGVDSIPA